MLIQTCWIELGRTVRSSDPCRFVVLGEVSHVTGDGGLQEFPGLADVIHCIGTQGRGLIRWNGDRKFARGDTRPYWTLGRKDSRALDTRPVGHYGVHRVDTEADSRSMWSNRDVYIEPVFTKLIFPQYSSVIGPSCLKILSAFHDYKTGRGISLCYVQILTQGGFTLQYSVRIMYSPQGETSMRYNNVYTV